MRDSNPAGYDESIRAWQVFGYDEAQRVLADPTFSADMHAARQAAGVEMSIPPVIERLTMASFFTMTPPTHKKFRGLVNQAFSRRLVNRLEPRIGEIAGGILAELSGLESFDLLERFAYPLPMIVLCELLGVPHDDRRAFQSWASILTSPDAAVTGPDAVGHLGPALEELEAYLGELVRRRRLSPQADLLSRLVTVELDDDRLTDEEVVSLAAVMLLAGHNTTTMLLANLVVCLDENPAAAAEIRGNRALIPSALEEVFRYRGPLPRALRLTTVESRIGEHTVPSGQPVAIWTAAANWDDKHFPHPERFDIRRSPNRHLGFGHGMHFCLGAPLARVVAEVATNLLLDHCTDISVNRESPLSYRAPRMNLAPDTLPVVVHWA
ncbi:MULTISPECIES: cytochrome P450 [unclassified Streptomyces]|nr:MULTISPECIES: cytochrome P450 [unclassified Streptomyces]MYT16146.1 cytochrome P450 [Streptomyces sp. SID4951]